MEAANRGWAGAAVGGALVILLGLAASTYADEAKPDVEVTMVAIQYEGTKLWVPGTLAVHKGDRVKVHLINKVPTGDPHHGWSIKAFEIEEKVHRDTPTTVEFVADKTGVFPIRCQLHAAHVGGQLIVLDDD